MKKRTGLAITALALLAMLLVFISSVKRQMRDAQETSSRRALLVQVEYDLQEYYDAHSKYPPSLFQLKIRSFPDGSSPKTLKHFSYTTDGRTYRLTVPSAEGDEIFVSESG